MSSPIATPQQVARELVARWVKEEFPLVSFNLLSDAVLLGLPHATNASGLIDRISTALEAREKSAREDERTRIDGEVKQLARFEAVEESGRPIQHDPKGELVYYDDVLAAIATEPEQG